MAAQKPKPKPKRKRYGAARHAAPAPEQQGPLAGYATLETWRERCAGPFFPTRASLEWFIRQHRPELVELGALVTRDGRAGSVVEVEKFSTVVRDIFHRQAAERMKA